LPVKATPAPVELSPPPESQPELETEPALARPVEPPGEQPHFIEPAPAENEQDQAELIEAESVKIEAEPVEAKPVEAESVSPPTELASPAPAETEPSLQPAPQPEPEPLPLSPRQLAISATPPPAAEDDWWSPIRQPEPATADKTLWSGERAAAATGDEPSPPAQLEPEITPGEDNLPPALQGKKVLKIAASQPPPVEAKTPETSAAADADTANWWSADESTKEVETDN
jgi:hypothetical protein